MDTILNATLVSAAVIFVGQIIWQLKLEKDKVKATIELLAQYAEISIKSLEDHINDQKQTTDIIGKIQEGNPYGEENKDFTPCVVTAEEDKLSFDQIRQIVPHIKPAQRKCLLEYFQVQEFHATFTHTINSDFFRSFPQSRKEETWEKYIEYQKRFLVIACRMQEAFPAQNKTTF